MSLRTQGTRVPSTALTWVPITTFGTDVDTLAGSAIFAGSTEVGPVGSPAAALGADGNVYLTGGFIAGWSYQGGTLAAGSQVFQLPDESMYPAYVKVVTAADNYNGQHVLAMATTGWVYTADALSNSYSALDGILFSATG